MAGGPLLLLTALSLVGMIEPRGKGERNLLWPKLNSPQIP
jgi:hypothetical protein